MDFFAGIEIAGVHSVGPYHIEPFAEEPHTLEGGLGSATPIIRFVPYSTGISGQHARQSIVLSLFSLVADTALREPVRFCTPILFVLLGVILLLRLAPKEKTVSVVPQKILEYVSDGVSRGLVVHHLRKLQREQKVYKSSGSRRVRYATKKDVLDSVSIQRERVGRHPTAGKNTSLSCRKTRTVSKTDRRRSDHFCFCCVLASRSSGKTASCSQKKSGRSFTYRFKEKEE